MTRFHDLDALRAVAMLLGIVLHAALFLLPIGWVGQDPWAKSLPIEQNPYAYLVSAIHGFRMPVFFLLSGFFTAMLWERHGLRQLASHRLKRIGLPLALGSLTIVPLTGWIWVGDQFEPILWPIAWMWGFAHLWFLWFLLWLAAAFIVLVRLGVRFGHPVVWWSAIPLTLVPQLLMVEESFGPDTSEGLAPDPVVLLYYLLFFVAGAFFYRRRIEMQTWWALALLPALMIVFPLGLATLDAEGEGWARVVSAVMQVAYAWLMCFGLIGLFRLIASRERPWVRYLSDASYWLYLAHLPLVAMGQALVSDWPISVHLKFALILLVAISLLLGAYQLAVRHTWVGAMLNGRRVRPAAALP